MIKTQAITNDITQNTDTQKKLLRILLASSAVLFTIYIYLIGSITFNVIARKTLEGTVVSLNGHINQLELTYLNNINAIDKEYALSNGFVEVKQNLFASRSITHVAIR